MEKKLRAVLAGCGGMSRTWLNVAKEIPDLEIVGLVDIREEAARKRAEEFALHQAVVGTDLRAVLDQTAPDMVFDCAVPEAHYPITMEALRHGCHVLGEKPLADSMEHAREMVETAAATGKIFAVMQNRRYSPHTRRMRAFVESGALGRITTINSDFYLGAHFGGFRDHMRHVLLLDMAIHTFDILRYISGSDPVAVYCKEWNPPGSWYDYDASAMAIFEMTDGLVYNYRGSWCAEGMNTAWESDWRIIGENGSVLWDGNEHFRAEVVVERGGFRSKVEPIEVPPVDPGAKIGGHAGLIKEFVHCVRTGETPETVASDNIKSLAMVFGAIESAEGGRQVAVK